jgi:peptidoglycan/xylan/chitin deacetylase (PgdA/CDA1 family)
MKSLGFVLAGLFAWSGLFPGASAAAAAGGVPILLYHRFGPTVADSMTVTTAVFESHLKFLQENGYRVIALDDLMEMVFGRSIPVGSRDVVLVSDDAHVSVYTTARPLLKKYNFPMTVFAYPSAVSNAPYAMSWDQLRELKATGLFDVQSHTLWHPNFKKERGRLAPEAFDQFVHRQLTQSRARIEKELGAKADLLAWPFGICDADLMARARAAGYRAAFSIERRPVRLAEDPMALPRYLLADSDRGRVFEGILKAAKSEAAGGTGNGKAN